jgi:hypothetical protein
MKENGLEMNAQNLAVMDKYWNETKQTHPNPPPRQKAGVPLRNP